MAEDGDDNAAKPRSPKELIKILPDPKDMPLKEYLHQMGVFCIEIHNSLNPEEIAQIAPLFCSPKFHVEAGYPENYMLATSMHEYVSNVKRFREKNPHFWTQATNLTVDVNEEQGQATIIATMETHGLLGASDALVRESVYMAYWRRTENGRWRVWRLEIMRGPGSGSTFE